MQRGFSIKSLDEWNISGCVYGLIVDVLEVVHSKTKTTNTNKKGKKNYGKNQL